MTTDHPGAQAGRARRAPAAAGRARARRGPPARPRVLGADTSALGVRYRGPRAGLGARPAPRDAAHPARAGRRRRTGGDRVRRHLARAARRQLRPGLARRHRRRLHRGRAAARRGRPRRHRCAAPRAAAHGLGWRAAHAVGWLAGAAIIAQSRECCRSSSATRSRTPRAGRSTSRLSGSRIEEIRIEMRDGRKLAAWYVPSRNGAAVLLSHGSGGSRGRVPAHVRMLARHGYGVLALDNPGNGESEGHSNGLGDNAQPAIAAGLDYLERRPDVNPKRIAGLRPVARRRGAARGGVARPAAGGRRVRRRDASHGRRQGQPQGDGRGRDRLARHAVGARRSPA